MRQPLVAGNWKMNGSLASAEELLAGIKAGMADVARAEVAVCPPFPYLPIAQQLLAGTPVAWGGQDLSEQTGGAYTGEVAGSMLADFGCRYVIIGHSERRTYHGESDALVARKFAAALRCGLTPIFCVGETLAQREEDVTEQVVSRQVEAVIAEGGVEMLGQGVIAYEPVWAIGTGRTATPAQAEEVHAFIRGRIGMASGAVADKVRILYGGSMNAANAAELLAQPNIDGGLIGGASLKAGDFLTICRAANT
jgi:triosephosphate isomerase